MTYIGRKILADCSGKLYAVFDRFKQLMGNTRKYININNNSNNNNHSINNGDNYYE